jgi:hypothetical protein
VLNDNVLRDKIFYMRSRGLTFGDAVRLLFPLVNEPNVFWLTFHEEYQRMFVRDYDLYEARRASWEKKAALKARGINPDAMMMEGDD